MEIIRDLDLENAPFPNQLGDANVKKSRSTGTTSGTSKLIPPPKTAPFSTKVQILQSLDTVQLPGFTDPKTHSSLHGISPVSSSGDSYHSSRSSNNVQTLRQTHTEASRLRNLKKGHNPVSATGRPTHTAPYAENFSRPRKASTKAKEDLTGSSLHSSPFSLSNHEEPVRNSDSTPLRDRGLSFSSSKSANTSRSTPLRPNTATSEPAFDMPISRNRHLTGGSAYSTSSDLQAFPKSRRDLREPLPRSDGMDEAAVRASFRSALTATSSFVGTSGTERSSFMTKSSSATSIYGREEGMSVDDAIGMYAAGFDDSGDDEPISRPASSQSHRSGQQMSSMPRDKSLPLPSLSYLVTRDAPAVFGGTPLPELLPNPQAYAESEAAPLTSPQPVAFQTATEGDKRSPIRSNNIQTSIPPDDTQDRYIQTPTGRDKRSPSQSTEILAPVPPDDTRDRYGFRKQSQYISLTEYDAWNGPYLEHLERRRKKWKALMKDAGLTSENPVNFPPKSTKIKRFIRKGIPPDWRGAAWFWYAGGPAIVIKHPGVYAWLVQQAAQGDVDATDEELIERDLNRTFPDNIRFKPDPVIPARLEEFELETPILKSLRRVLQAFSIYNPKIGYCQSLNFLAGLLLLFLEEEKAFWLLNIITKDYLPGTHEVSLEGANVDLGVLMTCIKESMPAIWTKIGNELDGSAAPGTESKMPMRLPPITLCCTAWFMSCFIGTLPIESTLRVWDSFFYEGSKTFFRIALAIFKVGEAEIRAVNDPMEVFQVVQTIPRRMIDTNALMEACFKRRNGFGHLSQETIEARRLERRAAYAEDRARAAGKGKAPSGFGRKITMLTRRKTEEAAEDAQLGRVKTGPSSPDVI